MGTGVPPRNPVVVALMIMLAVFGAFVAVMGYGILVQKVDCNCINAGAPRWAWLGAPVAIFAAGVVVLECAVFVAVFTGLPPVHKAVIAGIAAAAIETAAFLGTSYALTSFPNRGVFFPVTAAVVFLLPVILVVLWTLDARTRRATL